MEITIEEFNALDRNTKWQMHFDGRIDKGKWVCPVCCSTLSDGPSRALPFYRASVHCRACDEMLTRRTGGGQHDPFRWILVPKRQTRDQTLILRKKQSNSSPLFKDGI